MRVAWADIDIKARRERKEREITCIRRVAPLLAVITSPVLAILSARHVMPVATSGPLLLIATAIQLSSLWRLHSAERIAHSLIASDGPVRPIEKSLGDLARWTEAVAHRSAPTHPISGLPTREHFLGAVETHISANRGSRMLATVRFADFDRIAAFDQEGAHAALASLAQRLTAAVHRRHIVAQVDRDCFAIWLVDQPDMAAAEAELRVLAHLMIQEMPSVESVLSPTIEVGTAAFPADGDTPAALLARALSARTRPEFGKAGGVTLVQAASRSAAREAFVIEQDLAQAIAGDQLTMLFQPLVELKQHRTVGAEALLRWNHPTMGAISPARFIPIVERIGLSDQFGSWVLNTACREMRRWREAGLDGLRVAVNLSACQLADVKLREKIERTLKRHHLEPQVLELELTETAAMADAGRTLHLFETLHDLGVSLAIDDFGSGHSSLSYLKNLPFDKLKIDREFVTRVDEQLDSQAICKALIDLGRGLGLRVLAEGVETRAEVDVLARFGCTLFQGYYFSHPLSGTDFIAFARDPSNIPGLGTPVHTHSDQIKGCLPA